MRNRILNFLKELLMLLVCIAITLGFLIDYKTNKDIKILTERIDSINSPSRKLNHNVDSIVLYHMYGDSCPICKQKLCK